MIAKKVILKGKVQGVYFRASAKQEAMLLGVKGTIENKSDGSVFLEIEGEEQAVDNMIKWCSRGPALARVNEVVVDDSTVTQCSHFSIRT